MNILVAADDGAVVNELGPVLVFTIAFLISMGGIVAFAYFLCKGKVHMASLDFWKGIGKIQCR